MRNFALIGASGYIAPRHMQAIKATGNNLVAALDPNDSVGIIDSYFPEADFFTEFERFDRYLDKLRRANQSNRVEYISICSPNYLHDSHMRFALRAGANAVCEKPLVLNPWNIDGLLDIEQDTGMKVSTILQLRVHPVIVALRSKVESESCSSKHEVDLTYITSRGHWYLQSWKGDTKKSGGIATNIGVHFFDMLHYVFGKLQGNTLHFTSDTKAAGFLEYEHARVRWFLSIDASDVPEGLRKEGKKTFRCLTVDGNELEFSDGFTDLHVRSYEAILSGKGFGLEENRTAIETVSGIRGLSVARGADGEMHPFCRKLI